MLRRPLFLAALSGFLILVLALSLLSLFAKTNSESPSFFYKLPVLKGENASELRGVGIDLADAQTANLIQNPNFAPRLYKAAVPLARAEGNELISSYSAAQPTIYGDGFFDGADLRLVRASGGKQSELGLAKIESHLALQFGPVRKFKIASQEKRQDWPIKDVAWRKKSDGSFLDSIAVGDRGLLMTNVSGSNPGLLDLETDHDIVAAFGDADGYVCVSFQGEIFFSDSDLQNWQMANFTIASDLWQASDVIRIDQSIMVSGNQGRILLWEAGEAKFIQLDSKASINALCLHEENVIAVAADGGVWQGARNEEEEWQFEAIEIYPPEGKTVNWLQAESLGGSLILSGTDGTLLYGSEVNQLKLIHTDFAAGEQEVLNVVMLSGKNFIVHIPNDVSYYTDSAGEIFRALETTTPAASRFFAVGPDRLLAVNALNHVSIHPLESSFTLSDSVDAFLLEPGDVMILQALTYRESPHAPLNMPLWESSEPIELAEPSSTGLPSYQIRLNDSNLNQNIRTESLQADWVYSLLLRARKLDNAKAGLEVRISGPFPEQTFSFDITSKEIEAHEIKFLMPRMTGEKTQDSKITLISSGDVAIDSVFLAADKDKDKIICAEQETTLIEAKPAILRLSALGIGSAAVRSEQWVDNREALIPAQSSKERAAVFSLEEGLRLCRSIGAEPWVSVEAFTSPGELGDVIAYLAAGIDEPFGQQRLEQGTAVPWSSTFNRIYLEFKDDADVFKTIEEKLSFVNAMKSVVEDSPYFVQIKNKLVFVDGMDYEGERMLSSADFHGMDFPAMDRNAMANFPQIRKRYERYLLERPRQTPSGTEETKELMRLMPQDEFISQLSPSEQLYLLLYDYGEGSALINLDLALSENEMLFELSRMLQNGQRLGHEDYEQASVISFQTQSGPVVFVWATGEARVNLRLELGQGEQDLEQRYFDKKLDLQSRGEYRGDGQELVIMPGMLLVIS